MLDAPLITLDSRLTKATSSVAKVDAPQAPG